MKCILLMAVFLLGVKTFVSHTTLRCLGRCCNETDINDTVKTLEHTIDFPSNKETGLTTDMGNRSLSPWTYYLYNNSNMFPSQIRMAKCTGSRCINSQFNSVALNYTIQVYRRKECREGAYRLMMENFQVTVGCTCLKKK